MFFEKLDRSYHLRTESSSSEASHPVISSMSTFHITQL